MGGGGRAKEREREILVFLRFIEYYKKEKINKPKIDIILGSEKFFEVK